MAVYVDSEFIPYRHMKMSHMVADTLDELHAMADRLGLKRAWFQTSQNGIPHYDICASYRDRAISLGAVAIDRRGMVEFIRRTRAAKRTA